MSLFGNRGGIAIQNMQTVVNHRQVWRTKRGVFFYREKKEVARTVCNESPLEESVRSGLWQVLIGWVVAGQGENLPSSC